MIKDVVIKKLNKFEDERGWLMEIFRTDELHYHPTMSYVSVTKPGAVRTNINFSRIFLFFWDRGVLNCICGTIEKIARPAENI